jgi:hypothetical protein
MWRDENGKRHKRAGCTDKPESLRIGNEFENQKALRSDGLVDPRAASFRDHKAAPWPVVWKTSRPASWPKEDEAPRSSDRVSSPPRRRSGQGLPHLGSIALQGPGRPGHAPRGGTEPRDHQSSPPRREGVPPMAVEGWPRPRALPGPPCHEQPRGGPPSGAPRSGPDRGRQAARKDRGRPRGLRHAGPLPRHALGSVSWDRFAIGRTTNPDSRAVRPGRGPPIVTDLACDSKNGRQAIEPLPHRPG